ncbi:FKBP-type peptidyl-prolyl cis-trans isomerase [Campylobacter blaseri]|uniref:Peptidyl-prolyl cis-trans isomerase n=1 Tax=Campylobacter blaseri TaxID=2042961 RepID=A0A2P8QZC7_9BACT|nr:peptidylprolyl isomerase [Campylobacter blaseri]PSM51591.1 peptidylprolyl isomerase [Campylobacter blaseri]PSM53384.1 peptidylprolyl isomerase [Campylobacter blaseri]QKF86679.1 FKBP-type peptidyl-prolyl cis-trans isomerase [Campylobacter blaseri]
MTENKVITMIYELKDANEGTLLETNWNKEPISFITGFDQIIPKLEEGLLELNQNEEKTIRIDVKDGIGEYNDKAIQSVPKEQFAGIDLVEGMELFGQGEDNTTARVIVKAIGEEEVIVDFNHPYAGKDLEFKVKILETRAATEDEIKSGVIGGKGSSCGCGSKTKKEHECCGGGHHKHDKGHECCGDGNHGEKDDHQCCGGGHHKHDKEHECCKNKES